MGVVVSLVGGFGAAMAFIGALVAMAAGTFGLVAGVPAAGGTASHGFLAVLAAIVGMVGAIVARRRLRTGGGLLIASAAGGLAAVLWFYAVGAVLLVAAGVLAFWGSRERAPSR